MPEKGHARAISVMNSGTVPTIGSYLRILDETMLVKPMLKYEPSAVGTRNSVPKLQTYNNAFRNRWCEYSFKEALMNKTVVPYREKIWNELALVVKHVTIRIHPPVPLILISY